MCLGGLGCAEASESACVRESEGESARERARERARYSGNCGSEDRLEGARW